MTLRLDPAMSYEMFACRFCGHVHERIGPPPPGWGEKCQRCQAAHPMVDPKAPALVVTQVDHKRKTITVSGAN